MLVPVAGQTEMLELLLRWGCYLGSGAHTMTALHWAAERGHTACVQRLLQAGISPNSQLKHTYQGETFKVYLIKLLKLNLKLLLHSELNLLLYIILSCINCTF